MSSIYFVTTPINPDCGLELPLHPDADRNIGTPRSHCVTFTQVQLQNSEHLHFTQFKTHALTYTHILRTISSGTFLSIGGRVCPPLLPVKGERGEILGNTGILWQYGIITLLNFNRQDFVSKHLPKPLTFGEGKR